MGVELVVKGGGGTHPRRCPGRLRIRFLVRSMQERGRLTGLPEAHLWVSEFCEKSWKVWGRQRHVLILLYQHFQGHGVGADTAA